VPWECPKFVKVLLYKWHT